jgi:hypothetical protein
LCGASALELSSHDRSAIEGVLDAEHWEINNPTGAVGASVDPIAIRSEAIERTSSTTLYAVR